MSTRKIEAWHAAGLIDETTKARLIAYEAAHARPLALWAVFGIGALAIGLGLVSVVAANWEAIPGQLRLSVHLLLFAGMSAALVLRERQLAQISPWASEALVFILGVLGLTFFGHLGQVYQTSSPLWQPLAIWLGLMGPALLIYGRGWPVAALLMGVAVYCVWDFAAGDNAFASGRDDERGWLIAAFVTTLPALLAPFGGWMRARSERAEFWRQLEQLALTYVVGGASLACIIASFGGFDSEYDPLGSASQMVRAACGVLIGLIIVLVRPGLSGRVAGLVMAGAGVTIAVALGVNDIDLLAAGLFMALWIGIAAAALALDARGVFQLAVALVAVRLIILSFELASDLLLSGFGLIVSGLMILGVAWAAVRVSQTFAPQRDGEEAA